MHTPRRMSAALVSAAITATLIQFGGAAPAADAAATSCTGLTTPVYARVNPTTHATYLSTDKAAATAMKSEGFTTDSGVMFNAATKSVSGVKDLVGSRLLTKKGDFLTTVSTSEVKSAASKYGYTDSGASFYAVKPKSSSAAGSSCLVPVYRYIRGSKHVFTLSQTEYTKYSKTTDEGIAFYAAKSDAGTAPPPTGPGRRLGAVHHRGLSGHAAGGAERQGQALHGADQLPARQQVRAQPEVPGHRR